MGLRGPDPTLQVSRNRAIFERWLNGETLDSIGEDYHVTRERIRQIIRVCRNTPESPQDVDRIISRTFSKKASLRSQIAQRRKLKREFRKMFQARFDRDEVIRMIGMGEDPDILLMPDESLCELVHEITEVKRFFKYLRCSGCETVKPKEEFSPCASSPNNSISVYCRQCNTARHRQMVLDKPELRKRAYAAAIAKPNKARIYRLRHYYLSQGRVDEMPPLPPKGVPDEEIAAPPKHDPGYGLRIWRASQPKIFNRKLAVDKAKKIVKEDAASRNIAI